MNILLVAGGSPKLWPKLNAEKFDFFVGIDRGSFYILEQGWPLNLSVGDFDSISEQELQQISHRADDSVKAQAEKDDTDTQLALVEVFKRFPEGKVTIIGASGGRLDHFLSNIWLPLEPRFQSFIRQISLVDRQNSICYYPPGAYTVKKEKDKKYLAYVCLTPVSELSLFDSKYLLDKINVPVPTSYASNEFVSDTARFAFKEGFVAVVQSKDK